MAARITTFEEAAQRVREYYDARETYAASVSVLNERNGSYFCVARIDAILELVNALLERSS